MPFSRGFIFLFALLGFAIDRILKQYALQDPALERGVFVGAEWFGLRLHINTFFAGSLPVPTHIVLLVMLAVMAGIAYALYANFKRPLTAGELSLVLAGAVSNAADRLLYGGVVDYLVIPFGGVVNLADALVVAGVVLLVLPRQQHAH
ncbi:MAG: signal peptidase II [Patescibacteria group bacterium]|nr:signal peptidase II [Patescibacteria group bacterium]